MSRYNVQHPECYPISWLTATRLALKTLQEGAEQSDWVSVDWSRGEAGAKGRMLRLHAFRKGLEANKYYDQRIGEALDKGYTLTFKKLLAYGVWDIKLSWKKKHDLMELLRGIEQINS